MEGVLSQLAVLPQNYNYADAELGTYNCSIPYFMLFGGENAPNHGFWRENLRLGQI